MSNRADHQHQHSEVGIGEPVQNLLPQGWLNLNQPRVAGVQHRRGTVEASDGAAVNGIEQVGVIGRNQIDQFQLQSLLVTVGLGSADCVFGRRHIASPASDIGAQKCGGIVLQLLLHDVVELGSSLDHGMRRAGVAAGGHRGYIRSFQQEKSRRTGPASGGRDIDDDGHWRGEDPAHHLARGIEQAARRIDLDEHCTGVLGRGQVQPSRHIARADGLNGVVEVDQHHFRVLLGLLALAWQASVPQQLRMSAEHASRRRFMEPAAPCFRSVAAMRVRPNSAVPA